MDEKISELKTRYQELLMNRISYEDLKSIMEYDYYIFQSKERAILESENESEIILNIICNIKTNIESHEDAYYKFEALKQAYNELYQAEDIYLKKLNKKIKLYSVREKDALVSLIGQYYGLLKDGLSYDEIKAMIELDSAIFSKNEALNEDNECVIKSYNESKRHFDALRFAKVTLDANVEEKEKTLIMENKNTTLD